MKKPPIGIIPEYIWKERRLKAIDAAIKRYQKAGLAISTEWIFERNRLLYDINYRNNFTHEIINTTTQSPKT